MHAWHPEDSLAVAFPMGGSLPGGVAVVPSRFRLGKEGQEASPCVWSLQVTLHSRGMCLSS